MGISLEELAATDDGVRELESALLRLAPEIREHLAYLLLDSVGDPEDAECAASETARERWAAHQRGELAFISKEDAMAELRSRIGDDR